MGLWLCWRALKRLHWLLRAAAAQEKVLVVRVLTPVDHHHHSDCGCGHHHLPRDEELRAADGWYYRAAVVVTMGLRPCSGAVLVLLLAKVIVVYAWGVLSALMMAAGTGADAAGVLLP